MKLFEERFNSYYDRLAEAAFNSCDYEKQVDDWLVWLECCETLEDLKEFEDEITSKKNAFTYKFARVQIQPKLQAKKKEIEDKLEAEQQAADADVLYNRAKETFNSDHLFYHTGSLDSLKAIIESGEIYASTSDYGYKSGKIDEYFICLSRNASNHVQRNSVKWRYGLSLDISQILAYCEQHNIGASEFSWIDYNLERPIKNMFIATRPLRIIDETNPENNRIEEGNYYYYITFRDCTPCPIPEDLWEDILDCIMKHRDPVYAMNTKHDSGTYKWGNIDRYYEFINEQPSLSVLDQNLVDEFKKSTLYNEQEVRLKYNSVLKLRSIPIKDCIKGIVVDESLVPFLNGGKLSDIPLTAKYIRKLIKTNKEQGIYKKIDLSNRDVDGLIWLQQESIRNDWEVVPSTYRL